MPDDRDGDAPEDGVDAPTDEGSDAPDGDPTTDGTDDAVDGTDDTASDPGPGESDGADGDDSGGDDEHPIGYFDDSDGDDASDAGDDDEEIRTPDVVPNKSGPARRPPNYDEADNTGPDADADDASGDSVGSDGTGAGAGRTDAADGATADGGVQSVDPYPDPEGGGAPGAPDDQEMPLEAHVEEMISRLGVVALVMAVVAGLAFPFADRLINFLWYSFLPGSTEVCPTTTDPETACPYLYHPLALMFSRLKVSTLVGFVIALPVLVYQSYLFMRPGLYPRERKYYLASVPTSLILAGVGMAFAYFLVLPALFVYFTGYTSQAATTAFGLTDTFNLIVMMLGFFALIFQIPLFIMLAIMMGVTSRRWMADRRLYFWGGFATIAFLFSPDPTGMAPILVAVTMIVLFEGTLLLLYWTGDASPVPTAAGLTAQRPLAWLGAAAAGYLLSSAPLPGSYYSRLPAVVRDGLAGADLATTTPLLVGGALIAIFELVVYLYRKFGTRLEVYQTIRRARPLVWPLALLVGYVGSPDPVLLRRVDAIDLPPVQAVLIVVGLIAAFEVAIVALRWRENRA